MRRFFIDRKSIRRDGVVIEGSQAHHIKDVMRLDAGNRFQALDGTGRTYTLRIKRIGKALEAKIEKVTTQVAKMPSILLACALPKKSRFDYIVEKATELGVSDIVAMVTDRTIVKIDNKNRAAKQKRWERITVEASKQCGRDTLPKIYEARSFKEAVKLAEDLGYKAKILPCLCEGTTDISEVLSKKAENIAIFIGPEGDFTRNEVEYASKHGFKPVSLGVLVLKVDTACIFTLSLYRGRVPVNAPGKEEK